VLRTLVFIEKAVATRDGRWYRVRIMPYRTQDNVIDGVVITFIDITDHQGSSKRGLRAWAKASGHGGKDTSERHR
jgi:hypothetical protein